MTTSIAVHRDLGLTDEEYGSIVERLGREPSYTELAMFSVMWSEHCSYKSSRVHLKELPTQAPHVLVGPGEGAGIVAIAPGVAVAWKIESHNHPSFVEPVNGAATGVGGIVRDVLSMGARPIALMDPLRFGSLTGKGSARTGYLVDGVVNGISSYGNSIGVPTVGGEAVFDDCYAENILVNVACLGLITHRTMKGRAEVVGDKVVLIGSSTGRDGIGGASVLASAEFDDGSMDKRPAVQVGDPFTEKLLIEACLELVERDLLDGLQDLGAGGISCPASEMTAKCGTGIAVSIDDVHRREPGMEPFEVMISESQERMMAVTDEGRVAEVISICERWGLRAQVIGEITPTGRIVVTSNGEVVADAPVTALAEEGPVYDRPIEEPMWMEGSRKAPMGDDAPADLGKALLGLIGSPNIASKRWIWEQYDHMIFLGTLQGPGSDAAVIRLPGTEAAAVITTDGPGRYCHLDPYAGAVSAVAEAARNVACTGARPLAVTNCLNFGSPEKPEVMWQFAEVIRGMAEACAALGTPVTSGNVSFYNETKGRPIHPTPVIGMLGGLDDATRSVGSAFVAPDEEIVLFGATDPQDFGGSEYASVVNGALGGRPPPVDLGAEAALHRLLARCAAGALVSSAHDCSAGGLAITLAESALRSGIGFSIDLGEGQPHRLLFSESASRAVVTCPAATLPALLEAAELVGFPATHLGRTGGPDLDLGAVSVSLVEAKTAFETAIPDLLEGKVGV